MSDATLKKLEDELATLESELNKLGKAMAPSQACEELISYAKNTKDPMMPGSDISNKWLSTESAGCCSVS
jgi:hypothetical protein